MVNVHRKWLQGSDQPEGRDLTLKNNLDFSRVADHFYPVKVPFIFVARNGIVSFMKCCT